MPLLSAVRGAREDRENGGIAAGSVAQDFARAPAPRVAFIQRGTEKRGWDRSKRRYRNAAAIEIQSPAEGRLGRSSTTGPVQSSAPGCEAERRSEGEHRYLAPARRPM